MKTKLVLICVAAVTLLSLAACSSGEMPNVSVSCDDFVNSETKPAVISKQVEVEVGSSFTVSLCSNATTGYKWSEAAQISDPAVLQQIDHKFVPPRSDATVVGAAGTEVWTFKALNKGTTNVDMEYGRPWEGGEKGAWKFHLTVVAK